VSTRKIDGKRLSTTNTFAGPNEAEKSRENSIDKTKTQNVT